jgi:bifunctional non-homologous end joining protein LigD
VNCAIAADQEATAVLPYSVRARPGLPVAMPVAWSALGRLDPSAFTVKTVPERLESDDPWAAIHAVQQRLPKP